MRRKRTLQEVADWLKTDSSFSENIVHWQTIPEKPARTVPLPEHIHPKLKEALFKRGVRELYTHQLSAYDSAREGESFVAVTPTASGKTL
ncbi:MAG TPA: hypothetical protein VEY51_19660, partial [Chondromyces sp.]|nr:hypothetical protein [Chondromyces sp.]